MNELLNNEPITDLHLKRLLERINAMLLLANLTEQQKGNIYVLYTPDEEKLEVKLYEG